MVELLKVKSPTILALLFTVSSPENVPVPITSTSPVMSTAPTTAVLVNEVFPIGDNATPLAH